MSAIADSAERSSLTILLLNKPRRQAGSGLGWILDRAQLSFMERMEIIASTYLNLMQN